MRRRWRHNTNQRATARGMTLVEIMIVVIVMSLIATGVAYAVVPMMISTRERQTHNDARVLQHAVSLYMVQHGGCPESVEELPLSRSSRRVDAWGHSFVVVCDIEDEPVVVSPGRDGQQGTDDDISSAEPGEEGSDEA